MKFMSGEEIIDKVTQEKLKNVSVKKLFLKNKLNIPEYIKFGFEIEALINEDTLKKDMLRYKQRKIFNNKYFRADEEYISYEENEYGGMDNCIGGEIITPILSDCEESWIDIKNACEYLEEYADLTDNCSVHTNIGAEALGSDYNNWYNFCKIIAACEPEIYRYLTNGKEIRYIAISGFMRARYAMPIAEKLREGIEKSQKENVNNINTLLNNCGFNGDFEYKKDKSISLKGIYQTDNETIAEKDLNESVYGRRIEIRMANGTFSPVEIQSHLYVISRIIEISRNLTPEKNEKLEGLLKRPLPEDYNEKVDIFRVIDVANILFDTKEDKLQFLFTVCDREKVTRALDDKEEVLRLIREENMVLEFATEELQNDREVVLEAVKHGGAQLQYASENLKNDREIVLTAVRKYGRALQYASEELRRDKEIILEAVKKDKVALQYADQKVILEKQFFSLLYKDNDIVQKYLLFNQIDNENSFVEQMNDDETIYKYFLHEAAKGNKEIEKYVLKAFYNYYCADLELKELKPKKDKYDEIAIETLDIVRKANNNNLFLQIIETDGSLFFYLTEEEKEKKEIILKVLESQEYIFECLSPDLKNDKEVAMVAIKKEPYSIWHVGEDLKGDTDIALELIKTRKPFLVKCMNEDVQNNPIVITAISANVKQKKLSEPRNDEGR